MSIYGPPRSGPSRRVYRRRRLVALLVVIVVAVFVVVLVAHARGHSGALAGASPSPSAVASPSASPSATSGTSAEVPLCESSSVTVTAVTDASSYAAGQLPQLSLSVANHGSAPCRINVGTAQQVFTITSAGGGQVYWKSTDCQKDATNSEITLQPGTTLSSGSPISWDREASDPATCDGARSQVPAGGATYALETSVDGIPSATAVKFTLN